MADDELVSQFLMFTGSEDTAKAVSYLEMAAGNLEQAVSLFMDHAAPAAGPSSSGAGMMADEIRAPDETQTMRLMDDSGPGGMMGAAMLNPYMQMDAMVEEQLQNTAFASRPFNVREAVNSAAAAASDYDEDFKESAMDESNDDGNDDDVDSTSEEQKSIERLADMFSPPKNLIFDQGGFEGARAMAKDSKRWLLVNIQRDSEFASHALNRDVWRDELVENLVREGFIFWQTFDITPEGRLYSERYKVYDFPHIAIIDPRTRRLMWKKEGWTQQNPMTAEVFAESAMDFCSRHSFDKPPQAPRPPGSRPAKRPMHEMSEEEQLQAAMQASLQEAGQGDEGNDNSMDEIMDAEGGDGGGVEYVGSSADGDSKPAAKDTQEIESCKEPSVLDALLALEVGDEPSSGARIQLKMPDGKRMVRKFDPTQKVQTIYAFIAQSVEEAKGGKEFVLMAGFPPKDLLEEMDNSIESCKLSGQAITIRWK